jgi:hypothetical protein
MLHQPRQVRAQLIKLLRLLLLEEQTPGQGQESLCCRFRSAFFHALFL